MNLTKFLVIDVSLMLVGLTFLFIFQASKVKAFLLGDFKLNEGSNQSSINLPAQQKLLDLEHIARKDGSGITLESLIGLWKFSSVWKQETDNEDLISSSLLRLFSAGLEIKKDKSNHFIITNSIQFGLLSIRFLGVGNLKGKQPLLPFFFKRIELKAGSRVVFSRSLKVPDEKDRPFFALIAMEENGNWLSARGRGGGLALWIKDSNKFE